MAKQISATDEHEGTPQLLRPRFFPGQLLTDRNLTDILGWVKSRFLLTRGENAWGIVCGMSVSKGKKDSTCEVSAGVAVDIAGNPIAFHDSDPAAWKTIELPLVASIDRDNCTNIHAGSATSDKYTIGPYENVTAKKWAVFDLSVCAKDRDEDPVPTPCGKDRKCQETRTRESGELHLTRVKWSDLTCSPNTQPQSDRATELLAEFKSKYPAAFEATNGATLQVQEIRKWFTAKWNADPRLVRAYPGLPEVTEKNPDTWFNNPANVAKLLTWLTDSLRRSVEPCDFPTASCPANAVPLARIWAEAVGNYYHVRVIEDVSPLRREYGSETATRLNPRQYWGRNVHEVIAELGRLGIPAKGEVAAIPGSGNALKAIYEAESLAFASGFKPGEPVVAMYWKAAAKELAPFANGVFAFKKGDTASSPIHTGDPLKVRLFIPKAGMKIGEVKYDSMPPDNEEIPKETLALRAGGQFRIAVDLSSFAFDSAKRIYKFHYFDELSGKITALPDSISQARTIVANVKIPEGDRKDVSVTIFAEEQLVTPPRSVAVSARLATEGTLSVAALANPIAGLGTLNETVPGQQVNVIRLKGRDPELPLRLSVQNLSMNSLVPLRLLEAGVEPSSPDAGESHDVVVQLSAGNKLASGEISIPMPKTNTLFYWVYKGSDFGREFCSPPLNGENLPTPVPRVSFADVNLTVLIQPTTANKANLVLKNAHGSTITVKKGAVRQLAGGAIATDAGSPTINNGAEVTTPNLHRVNDTDYWRVELEYTLGGDATSVFAAIEVKAEPVVPVAPVPGPA